MCTLDVPALHGVRSARGWRRRRAGAAVSTTSSTQTATAAVGEGSGSSLEAAAAKAGSTGRAVAMSLIGLAFAVAATVLAFRRDFKEAAGVFAVGIVSVLLATPAGVSLLRDTVDVAVRGAVMEIRSYRRVFDLERRIYSVDRLRLNPGGVPVRGVVYFLALLATGLLAAEVPLAGALARALPWYLRDVALPGAGATVLSAVRLEGRTFHLAAHALLRSQIAARRLVGMRRRAGVGAALASGRDRAPTGRVRQRACAAPLHGPGRGAGGDRARATRTRDRARVQRHRPPARRSALTLSEAPAGELARARQRDLARPRREAARAHERTRPRCPTVRAADRLRVRELRLRAAASTTRGPHSRCRPAPTRGSSEDDKRARFLALIGGARGDRGRRADPARVPALGDRALRAGAARGRAAGRSACATRVSATSRSTSDGSAESARRSPSCSSLVSLREPERDVASYVSRAAGQHPREWWPSASGGRWRCATGAC